MNAKDYQKLFNNHVLPVSQETSMGEHVLWLNKSMPQFTPQILCLSDLYPMVCTL